MITRILLLFALLTTSIDLLASPMVTRKLSGEQTAIGGAVSEVSISPDGEYAVYRGDLIHEGIQELFSVRITNGTPKKISTSQALSRREWENFFISPDSSQVYFLADGKIYRTPIDGTAPPIITHGELGYFSPELDNWISRKVQLPRLGNNGQYLYFHASDFLGYGGVSHSYYRSDLFRIDLTNHSVAENLTESTPASKQHIYKYEVSDDSRSLLACTLVDGGRYGTASRVFHIDLTTKNTTLLPTPDYVPWEKMSPNGEHVLISWREEIVNGSLRQFPPLPDPEIVTEEAPLEGYAPKTTYSPDSQWIIFRTASGLFKRPTAGGATSLISQNGTPQFFDETGRLVFSAHHPVGEKHETHLYSVKLDANAPPFRISQHPITTVPIEQSPDRRSVLFFEQLPNSGEPLNRRLVIARIDGSSPPQQLNDPEFEPLGDLTYSSPKFAGKSNRVTYTKGLYSETPAIYTASPQSPPQLVTREGARSSPRLIHSTADTNRVFFLQAGELFAFNPSSGGGGLQTQLSSSAAIGADVSAIELTSDGTQAVFLLDADSVGKTELFAIPTDGGTRRKLSHQLATEPRQEYVQDFRLSPNGQIIYFSSFGTIYSVGMTGSTPPILLGASLHADALEWNADRQFLLGVSGYGLVSIDPSNSSAAKPVEGFFSVTRAEFETPSGYSLWSTATRAIYLSDRQRAADALVSWPLDGSTHPIDLVSGVEIDRVAVAPSIDRVIYQTDSGAIFSVPTAGGNSLELLEPDRLYKHPDSFTVTADGQWLIYEAIGEIWKIPTTLGGEPVHLTEQLAPQEIISTALASDGKKLLYAARSIDDGLQVYSVGLNGDPIPDQIFSATGHVSHYTKLYSAGSQFLLFARTVNYDFKLISLSTASGSLPVILNSDDEERTYVSPEQFVLSNDQSRVVFLESSTDENGIIQRELVSAPTDGSERGTPISTTLPDKFSTNADGSVVAYISNRENPTIDELFVTKLNPEPTSYDGWLVENFSPEELTAPETEADLWHRNSDPDADGIENWLERITALNPHATQATAPYEFVLNADKTSSLRFRSAKTLSSTPIIECSEDLTNWRTAAKSLRVVSDQGNAWLLETHIDTRASDRIFIRLRDTN